MCDDLPHKRPFWGGNFQTSLHIYSAIRSAKRDREIKKLFIVTFDCGTKAYIAILHIKQGHRKICFAVALYLTSQSWISKADMVQFQGRWQCWTAIPKICHGSFQELQLPQGAGGWFPNTLPTVPVNTLSFFGSSLLHTRGIPTVLSCQKPSSMKSPPYTDSLSEGGKILNNIEHVVDVFWISIYN